MPHRASRLTLTLAVLVAVLSGLGSTAQVDDPVIGPYYEDASEAELAFYDTEFPCPAIDGLINNDRFVSDSIASYMEIKCDYRVDDTSPVQTFRVNWYKTDYASYSSYLCADVGERTDDGTRIRDVVNDDLTMGVRGEFALDRAPESEAGITAAMRELMAAVTPFARTCAEFPAPLDCPEVPGHALRDPGEPRELQPDTFEQGCFYEASSDTSDDSFKIEVWWAAPRGVPQLYDRLCNELPSEGVGVGVLVAPGISANVTYWRSSPLEGPDVVVAAGAAQALLDQAAAVSRSCEGAEVLASDFQPFPDYLEEEFSPALTATPPSSGGGISSLPSAAPSSGSSDGGFIQTLIRIGSVVMFGLSMLGLFITFLLIRRETRIREKRDMLRIAITVAVSVAAVLIIGRDAPLWAILVAVGLGIALGTWQGSSLIVRSTERGLMAKRSMVAIVAFGSGVLLMQAAGFLSRSGGVTLGVAVSFLSAALTAGLFIGRKPVMAAALGGAAKAILPVALLIGLVAGFGAATGQAQTDPNALPPGTCGHFGLGLIDLTNCEGYESLLDVVPWDTAFVTGGLWSNEGKPPTPISLPRALATPPEPVTQTVTWTETDSADNQTAYEVTETYSFGLLETGACCSVFYEASGTRTKTSAGDGEVTVETTTVSGRMEDIHPIGTIPLSNDSYALPFTEVLTLSGLAEDSCQRVLAWRQEDNEAGAGIWDSVVIDGESSTSYVPNTVTIFVDCDLADFTYEKAFALAPPIPAANDPVRVVGAFAGEPGETCPVRQEFFRLVSDAGLFEGVQTATLADLFLEPNAPQCDYGGLFDPPSFGQGGRGGTRHEIIYRLAILNDPVAEAARLADDEDTFFSQGRTTSIPLHKRCELGPDGVPLQPADESGCRYISIHSLDESGALSSLRQTGNTLQTRNVAGGVVYIETDWDTSDGPNVTVRAHLPWGKYIYRCHHCTPGSPSISNFIRELHRFGVSRGQFDPAFDETPAAADPTTETTEADPRFTEDTEFTPIGEEEGITEEEAALIGLIGLLGSMGLLGASLEGTGLTPRDIAEAVRRGDLTGGVDAPPELLDEKGNPLTINDGSFPEAPVGHVWWGTDGDEGRWVSPEEAQDLVNTAMLSDARVEQEYADALDRQMERSAGDDWQGLINRSRAEAAADRMAASLERARVEVMFGTDDEGGEIGAVWDTAMESGEQDLVDFIDRSDSLTPEQIVAINDAINRRGEDQAALDAIPEVNILREGVEGTLNDLADLADAAGQPGIGWILRNPGVSIRVGAAVASGGATEFIAVPIDIGNRLHEAQERSLRENGRMMTSDELFGELGWALGTEAVYEIGGRLAGAGLGRVFSSTDEIAEAGIRQLDEAGEAATREGAGEVSEAVSREASELVEAGGRSGDEALPTIRSAADEGLETGARHADEGGAYRDALSREGDEIMEAGAKEGTEALEGGARINVESGARGGGDALSREGIEAELEAAAREASEGLETAGRGTREGMESAGREGSEALEGGGRSIDEAAEAAEELTQAPPKGNEAIRDLETGQAINDDLMPQTGLPRQQLDDLQAYTRENDLNAVGRATNPHSAAPLADGSAVGKPLEIKIKTGTDIDVLLGAHPNNRGVVTLFEPRMPNTAGMSDDLIQTLERRHAERMLEWNKHSDTWTRGNRVTNFGGTERTHRFIQGRIEVLVDGKWRKVGGDFDLVDLTRADGTPLSAIEFQQHVDAMVERGLIEHGGEVRVMTDLMRNNPHPPGTEEWMDAAREAWELRNRLENGQLGGGEINIGINGTHGIHRAPDIDEFLPWAGGFETPSGTLLGS